MGNTFLIKEIFLLDQYAAPTTTEISSESLANWANELMTSRGDGMDIVNSIRFWGHSHVHMPTSPSYQDDTQMRTFASDCDDFFIRGILNKLGRMEFTIYLFDKKLEIHDAAWSIYVQDEDNARRERWQAEINAKVKDMYFPTPGSYGRKGKKKYAGFPKDEFPEFPGYENMQDEAGFYNSGYRFNSTNPNDSEL